MKLNRLTKIFKYTCIASILFPALGFCKITDVSQCPVITPNDIEQVIDQGAAVTDPDATFLRQCINFPYTELRSGHYRAAFVVLFSEDNKIENVYYSDGKSPLQKVVTDNQMKGIERLLVNMPPNDPYLGPVTSLVLITFDNQPADHYNWEFYKFYKSFNGQPIHERNNYSTTESALYSIELPFPGQFTKGIAVPNEDESKKISGIITTALDDYTKQHFCQNCYLLNQSEENKTWALIFNDMNGNVEDIPVANVDGLQEALNQLPADKFAEHMTYKDIYNVDKILENYRVATSSANDIQACEAVADGYYKLTDTGYFLGAKKKIDNSLYIIILHTIFSGSDNETRLRAKNIFLLFSKNKMNVPLQATFDKESNICKYNPAYGKHFFNPYVIFDTEKYVIKVIPDSYSESILSEATANMQSDDWGKFESPEDFQLDKKVLSVPVVG